jgi:hypothetical protein
MVQCLGLHGLHENEDDLKVMTVDLQAYIQEFSRRE